MEVIVRTLDGPTVGQREVEIVERKGLGHPDTICDGIAEHVCVRLCRHYLERFGRILHHNVDKVLLCGGSARAAFGGGEVLEPIDIYLAGRATTEHLGERIAASEIAVDACREWLRTHLANLDVDRDVRIVSRLRPGSSDLTHLFGRDTADPLANDTSCGAGFAPLTDLEKVVLEVERALNSPETKARHPAIGEDIKVMGVRRRSKIDLTIGCAFVGHFVRDAGDYATKKDEARAIALEAARRITALSVEATLNAGDDIERGDVFLTTTGTSAEAGDDGEVGRGNRTSGLITPYRPMTLEAAAGKNPVTHVGKLYNLVASRIAEAIVREVAGVADASCVMVTRIGHRVSDPRIVDVAFASDAPGLDGTLKHVTEIVRGELSRLSELRDALLREELRVY